MKGRAYPQMKRMIEGRVVLLTKVGVDSEPRFPYGAGPGVYALVKIDGEIAPPLNARMIDHTSGNIEQAPIKP